jgi:hypothetical protein
MSNPTQRPEPTVRKEVVPTTTWGDLVVRCMSLSQRLGITDVPEIEGESAAERSRRVGKLFTSRLMAEAVIGTDGATMYDAEGWDVWLGTENKQLEPVVKKAMALNNFNLGGDAAEDTAKNG